MLDKSFQKVSNSRWPWNFPIQCLWKLSWDLKMLKFSIESLDRRCLKHKKILSHVWEEYLTIVICSSHSVSGSTYAPPFKRLISDCRYHCPIFIAGGFEILDGPKKHSTNAADKPVSEIMVVLFIRIHNLQGRSDVSRQWSTFIHAILGEMGLISTTYEPCLYHGIFGDTNFLIYFTWPFKVVLAAIYLPEIALLKHQR